MNYLIKLLFSISALLFAVLDFVLFFEGIEENVAHSMSYEMYLSKVRFCYCEFLMTSRA